MKVVALRSSRTTLDEIRRNRYGTAPELALQTQSLRGGEGLRGTIHVHDELVREYECVETVGILGSRTA